MLHSISWPVKLRGSKVTNFPTFVHFLIEKWVFFKWQSSKNEPRANYLLLRAVFSVLIVILLSMLFSVVITNTLQTSWSLGNFVITKPKAIFKGLLFWFGTSAAVFWNHRTVFHRQWEYSANLYNTIFTVQNSKRDLVRCSLAIDLVVLDLWAHRSFQQLFANQLLNAVNYHYSKDSGNAKASKIKESFGNRKDFLSEIANGQLREDDALTLLEDYHRSLILNDTER